MDGMTGAGISVSELTRLISESLRKEPRLRSVTVTAEVSGFKHHLASGHWYFLLKDQSAAISCVMFRQNTFHTAMRPADGDRVTVQGYVEIFARDGKVQLYVTEMKPAGLGNLYEKFELLKRKLAAEGLFDPGKKRMIPLYPRKVAVITSASGAALHDILNVSKMRNPTIPIVLIPSGVQGVGAAEEMVSALQKVPLIPEIDTVIIGRGGGSPEDLWCFNEEILARAVAACPVPVVSGVGHETDFTICDYVADFRASTPSNAAEVVFPDRDELRSKIRLISLDLCRTLNDQLHLRLLRVQEQKNLLQRLSPEKTVHTLIDRIHQSQQQLGRGMDLLIRKQESELAQLHTRVMFSMDSKARGCDFEIRQLQTRFHAISPLKVQERGYALVCDPEGSILPNMESAKKQKEMEIRFWDGSMNVLRKEPS